MIRCTESITPEQRNKESAVFWAILLDTIAVLFMLTVGLFSGSMTVLSEILRILLLLTIEIVSYEVLRRSHRGRFLEYEFGTGKIERIVNLLVALGLCVTCLYIFSRIISIGDDVPLSLPGLFWAVVAADMNLIINVWFTMAFIRVNQTESSIIISSQIKSRLAKTVATVIVLSILMLTLWLPDPKSARIVDMLGSIFVLCYMVVIAVDLIRESLPEILDRSVPDPAQYQILRILAEHFDDYDGFHGYRTRRSGKDLFVNMTLEFLPETSISEIEERLRSIRQHMAKGLPGSNLTIESGSVDRHT